MTTETTAGESLVTLANASELAVSIILNVVGNDISDSINGAQLSSIALNTIVQARFNKSLNLR